jgi:TRAP-type C4-dicarboxylate transport system permease small subunit
MKALLRVEQALASMAIASIAVMMVLVSMDAIGRYAFNRPLTWASELTTFYLMAVAIYFMVGATLRHGDHININVFRSVIPKRVLALSDIVWSVATALVFVWIAYASFENIVSAYAGNDFRPGFIKWPVWLSHVPLLIGTASIVAGLLVNIVLIATGAADPYAETAEESAE